MTGYGQARATAGAWAYELEVRSVNHRFLDLSIKLPRNLGMLEYELRPLVLAKVNRGKIDLSISRRPVSAASQQTGFDLSAFEGFLAAYRTAFEASNIPFESVQQQAVLAILARGDVFPGIEELTDPEAEKSIIVPLLNEALQQLTAMRSDEGAKLRQDLLERLAVLKGIQEEIRKSADMVTEKLRDRIYGKVKRLEPEVIVDEARLAAELVLYCDRADITEELVRLDSHFSIFDAALGEESQGRKLDFIAQEFLREFNTIASKAQDGRIQSLVVDAKTGIEKMKEQIQNIE